MQIREGDLRNTVMIQTKRILILDDEQFNIDALKIILKYKVGIDSDQVCDQAKNGIEALNVIKKDIELNHGKHSSYHLILMDCQMPLMDGYESTK